MTCVPVITLDEVFHLGSLRPSERGSYWTESQEGGCLSVSLCPRAWREIAGLSGDLHVLRRTGGLFIDVRGFAAEPSLSGEVSAWAKDRGLLEETQAWRVRIRDLTSGAWWHQEFRTEQEAMSETEGFRRSAPVRTPILRAASELEGLTGFRDAFTGALAAWGMLAAPDLLGRPADGLWWRSTFSPDRLSAPRGGIFQQAVGGWSSARSDLGSVRDRRSSPRATLLRAAAPQQRG